MAAFHRNLCGLLAAGSASESAIVVK